MNKKKLAIVAIILIIMAVGVYIAVGIMYQDEEPYQPSCGDGYCDPDYESWQTCPIDCPKPSCNNDGICDPWEDDTCVDCQNVSLCGNGVLDDGENCQTCPEDAGGPCQEDTPGIGFRRPLIPIYAGDIFWVTVYIEPPATKCIGAYKITMSYDDTKLQYVNQAPGAKWTQWFSSGDTSVSGVITNIQSMNTEGSCNKENIFSIQFKALGEGNPSVSFDTIKITDPSGTEITSSVEHTDNTIIIRS